MASLRKFEILSLLSQNYDVKIKSVQKLNKVLEEMGLLEHCGNGWLTTVKGLPFSIYNAQVMNADLWRESIVKEVAKYVGSR